MRELVKEFATCLNRLMLLTAQMSDLARNGDVLAFAKHPSERIARQAPGTKGLPRHDHSGVQSPREGHCYWAVAPEVAWKASRKCLAQVSIEGFVIEGSLVFPLPRIEIALLGI